MTVLFPSLSKFRNALIQGIWNFADVTLGGEAVATTADILNPNINQDITGDWNFKKTHTGKVFAFTGDSGTGDQELKGMYQFHGTSNQAFILSNDTFEDVRAATAIWEFKFISFSEVSVITVKGEVFQGDVISNDGGSAKISTPLANPHPFSAGSEIRLSNGAGTYNGTHTVTERIDENTFVINASFDGSLEQFFDIQSRIIGVSGGGTTDGRSYSGFEGNTFWNDGINWCYYED